jgi:hypothetical protein
MRSSLEQVESGVSSANSAGSALTSIIDGSVSMQKMVTQIAAAATEQSYSTQSVVSTMGEIASIIEHTADSSQQSVVASEELSQLANELAGLVGAFKVGAETEEGTQRRPNERVSSSSPRSATKPPAHSPSQTWPGRTALPAQS